MSQGKRNALVQIKGLLRNLAQCVAPTLLCPSIPKPFSCVDRVCNICHALPLQSYLTYTSIRSVWPKGLGQIDQGLINHGTHRPRDAWSNVRNVRELSFGDTTVRDELTMHQENKGDLSFYWITATDNYLEGSGRKQKLKYKCLPWQLTNSPLPLPPLYSQAMQHQMFQTKKILCTRCCMYSMK